MRTHKAPLRPPSSRIKDIYIIISTLALFYLAFYPNDPSPPTTAGTGTGTGIGATTSSTTIRHLLFSIASSSKSFPNREPYIRLWYRPHITRAYLFLDRQIPNPTDPSLPPILISSDTSQFPYTFPRGLRSAVRVARIVKEAVELNEPDVRWYVFGDDDTIFFTDNLVSRLSVYDHEKWYYVGSRSESYEQNEKYSFDMAFGGGGFAISCGLARVLARVLDSCLMRYPHLYGSDARIYSCVVELGVELTHEPGFHQVDVRGDIFGMLSAHPLSPLLSLHHLDTVDPIFPGTSRSQALERLFEAANADPARILQRAVCYDSSNSLTVSVAWGYAVQVFEGNQLLTDLLPLQKTFRPWKRSRDAFSSRYMFNTMDYPNDPCERPVPFFLESVVPDINGLYTYYGRHMSGNCLRTNAIQNLERIEIFSKMLDFDTGQVNAQRRQCCDISSEFNETMAVGIRACRVDELISMLA